MELDPDAPPRRTKRDEAASRLQAIQRGRRARTEIQAKREHRKSQGLGAIPEDAAPQADQKSTGMIGMGPVLLGVALLAALAAILYLDMF